MTTPVHLQLRSPEETERTLCAAALQYGSAVALAERSDDLGILDHAEVQLHLAALTYYRTKNGAETPRTTPQFRPDNLLVDDENDGPDDDEMFAHP